MEINLVIIPILSEGETMGKRAMKGLNMKTENWRKRLHSYLPNAISAK